MTMANIAVADFASWYEAIRGRPPLPWMVRLAHAMRAGIWPDVLALPTGAAKTEIIAIWLWSLASAAPGSVPRRLWMASDRRVIADRAERVARDLQARLADPPAAVQAVAATLRSMAAGGEALRVGLLRGGIVTDTDALLDPVTPTVVATTVDQVGSRLLWRAYGAGPRLWPVWAGLVGEDSLIVLDEAHLSKAAEVTLRRAVALGAGFRLMTMTATPREAGVQVFTLDAEDRDHPLLRQRLAAQRLVELRRRSNPASAMVEAATALQGEGAQRVAVVCNTVRRAREVFESLRGDDGATYLVIGRSRPLDREEIMAELEPRIESDAPESPPLIVVSTQCIEAGADYDFDAMVIEACPLDALRQRLGRLDRLGRAGCSRCVLVAPTKFEGAPPYGPASEKAWNWLEKGAGKAGVIDLGYAGWERLEAQIGAPPVEASTVPDEPVTLLEPHLRLLARTWPRPAVEPGIDLLLHGVGRQGGDVSLIWRADVDPGEPDAAAEILSLVPPTALEAVQVPVWEVVRWLARPPADADADDGDVEGALEHRMDDKPSRDGRERRALRWLETGEPVEVVRGAELRPGDVLIVPASWGGCDRWGWCPKPTAASAEPVVDRGDVAWLKLGRSVKRVPLGPGETLDSLHEHLSVPGQRVRTWSGGAVVEPLKAGQTRVTEPEVPLDEHTRAVEERVTVYAKALGIDAELLVLVLAARWHDVGKRDPRWQAMIRGGDWSRLDEPPLAKGPGGRGAMLQARLPAGWRHEAESLRQLDASEALAGVADPDLLRWLVATHHGYGRPWWPAPAGDTNGVGLARLMDRLGRRYGWWRLAWYEAILRCADQAVSRSEPTP